MATRLSQKDIGQLEARGVDPATIGVSEPLEVTIRPGHVERLDIGEFIQNEDGSRSTERSTTVNDPRLNGGAWTNIPTIYKKDGKIVELDNPDKAVEFALQTGQEWQSYSDEREAVAAAVARSNQGGRFADAHGNPIPGGSIIIPNESPKEVIEDLDIAELDQLEDDAAEIISDDEGLVDPDIEDLVVTVADAVTEEEPPEEEPIPGSTPPGFVAIPPSEYRSAVPEGFTEVPTEIAPDAFDKIASRFLGTDVNDPLELIRMSSIIAGGIGGGIAGGKIASPAMVTGAPGVLLTAGGVVAGTMIGVIGGTIAPEMTIEALEGLGVPGFPEGTRERLGLSPEDLRTVLEGELLLELASLGMFGAIRLGGRTVSRAITRPGKEGTEIAEESAELGIDLLPVQVGRGRVAKGFVTVMGRLPWMASALKKRAIEAERNFERVLRESPERIAPLMAGSALGVRIFDDATELVKNVNDEFKEIYGAVFKMADEFGTRVAPNGVIGKAEEVITKLRLGTTTSAAEALGRQLSPDEMATAGVVLQKVSDFLKREVMGMSLVDGGNRYFAKQTLQQMDSLISKIDQEIASMEPAQRKFARSLLMQVRQAAQKDVMLNTRGPGADAVSAAMTAADRKFSETMSQLFETSTAKKFGTVERRGLRGVGFDKATRTPVDRLAKIVVDLDSPQAIEELSRLVTPETFQRIAAATVGDAVSASMRNVGEATVFDPVAFAKYLGLDDLVGKGTAKSASRKVVIERLLRDSGLSLKEMETLVKAGQKIAGVEIPNIATMVARRTVLGGVRSGLMAFLPGVAAGGAAGAAAGWDAGALMGALMFVGGNKFIARLISHPRNARSLRKVLDKEATRAVRQKAFLDAGRATIMGLSDDKEISRFETTTALIAWDEFVKEYTVMLEELVQ